jgi:hypothetical protein|uniref:Uncharacterized protein n=1 Tax=Populus trichocarpa TaxID=3694 RepID=A0A2K2C455_POPTR
MVFVDLTSFVLCPNALYNVKPNQSNACLFHNFSGSSGLNEVPGVFLFKVFSLSRLVDNSLSSFTWNSFTRITHGYA